MVCHILQAPAMLPTSTAHRRNDLHKETGLEHDRSMGGNRRQSANASGAGQEQTRLRSPQAPSIRRTGGQYLVFATTPAG